MKIVISNNDAFVDLIRDAETIYYIFSLLKIIAGKLDFSTHPTTIGIPVNGGAEVFKIINAENETLTVEYV